VSSALDQLALGGSYRVFAIPALSPDHGSHDLASDVEYLGASPFGWHDYDGETGADFTVTRGNNVNALLDRNEDFTPDEDQPDGGADLIFDFPFDNLTVADDNLDAIITNSFYLLNWMHDATYLTGFDEAAGNFQQINYTGQGISNDEIYVMEGAGSAANNASFATQPDGANGQMRVGHWDVTRSSTIRVTEPVDIGGAISATTSATDGSWGHIFGVDPIDVTADVILAFDDHPVLGSQCCNEVETDCSDKIAIIDRGGCFFSEKAFFAQEAGAVGVIICNVPGADAPGSDGNDLINMGAGGTEAIDVTIPAVFIGFDDCNRIKAQMDAGINVEVNIKQETTAGAETVSAGMDNGVLMHEFGHGISNRLVGGPSFTGALNNGEQMGEGYSDYTSLIYTVEPGHDADTPRGIGTYVIGETVTGRGIRTFPYSRDMAVCPWTYDNLSGTNDIYITGSIWTSMIWDLYWNFVDLYGYDADWSNTESGNHKAVLLTFDGMKFGASSPSLTDARDGILAADMANFNGDHQCMIWETFARRGLGYYADAGSNDDVNDGVADYSGMPTCILDLKISKVATELIEPGEDVDVTLTYVNHKLEPVTGVVITDEIPEKLTYIPGSGSIEPVVSGNMLSWDIGDLASLEGGDITYKLASDPADQSGSLLYDDMENEETSRQSLIFNNLVVAGDDPVLRFWHMINSPTGIDGGFVEISNDGGNIYVRMDDEFIKNGYSGGLAYGTFVIPNLNAFSGENDEFIDSYIDLSAYKGQTINVKFWYGSDGEVDSPMPANNAGWFVDDFELLDLLTHRGSACISSAEGDDACTDPTETVVNSEDPSTTFEADVAGFEFDVFPNPASEMVNISVATENKGDYQLEITSLDGRIVNSVPVSIRNTVELITIDTKSLMTGFYIVKLETKDGLITRKLIIE